MARTGQRDFRRPEDWFPPVRSPGTALSADVTAEIATALAALLPIDQSDVTDLVADLADKRDKGTVDATLQVTSFLVKVDATAGATTVNLPAAASSANRIINIKKIDASANTVTVDGNGAETIDGGATAVLTVQWECITIMCDGAQWLIL